MGLDLTIFTMRSSPGLNLGVTVVAPIPRASIPVGRHVTLEPDLPFVYYDVSAPADVATFFGPGDSGFLPGNPTFVAKYHAVNQGTDAYVGGGLALPLAHISKSDASGLWKELAYSAAWGTRGLWNVWWYYPDALTLFLPVGIRYVGNQGLDVGVEGAVGVLMYTGSGSNDPRGAAQIGGHVGYASSSVEAGLRLRGVRIPGDAGDDHFQGSIEPYVRGLVEHAFFGGGFIMNLDQPVGPLLDHGSIWGLRLEGGARF